MTYKKIKKDFDGYESYANTTFQERGEGKGSNYTKDRKYLNALNKRDAAFAALFDIYNWYKNEVTITNEKKQEWLNNFEQMLEEQIDSLEKKVKTRRILEKIENLKIIKNVYSKTFKKILSLNNEEFSKLMTYAEKKLNVLNKIYTKSKTLKDKEIVNELTNDINTNYYMFKQDEARRKNRVHHVGTSLEYIKAYEAKITKEKIKYDLLLNGVKDGLNASCDDVSKEAILEAFSRLESYPDDEVFYADEEAYDLSQNTFGLYDKTYKQVFVLSKAAKNKLRKNLKNKLN